MEGWMKKHAALAGLERNGQCVLATGSWMVCSVGMLVFNKLAIRAFPLPCTLVATQMAFTVLVLVIFCWQSLHIGSLRDALRWCTVVPFFLGMLLTSMFALKAAPMSLVITFRALSPCITLAAERFYPNPPRVKVSSMWPLLLTALGAMLYARDLVRSAVSMQGIGWVFLNSFFSVGDRLLQFLFLGKEQKPVDISKTGVTLILNLAGMLPVLLVAFGMQEHTQFAQVVAGLDSFGMLWFLASCCVGVGISFLGIVVQSMITATSFLVLINANKFLVILLEVSWLQYTANLTALQIFGAMLALVGSIIWTMVKEDEAASKSAAVARTTCSTDTEAGEAENAAADGDAKNR